MEIIFWTIIVLVIVLIIIELLLKLVTPKGEKNILSLFNAGIIIISCLFLSFLVILKSGVIKYSSDYSILKNENQKEEKNIFIINPGEEIKTGITVKKGEEVRISNYSDCGVEATVEGKKIIVSSGEFQGIIPSRKIKNLLLKMNDSGSKGGKIKIEILR